MARNGATRKKLLILIVGLAGLALGAGTSTPAFATGLSCGTICAAQIVIGGQAFNAPVRVGEDGLGTISNFRAQANGITATIDRAMFDPDPAIHFGVGATNLTPINIPFSFMFFLPIDISGTINASSSIGYTLTSVANPPNVTLFASPNPTVLTAFDFSSATGLTVNKGVDVGPTATGGFAPCGAFVGFTSNCGPFADTNTFSGAFPAGSLMIVKLDFILTPNASAGLSGAVVQEVAAVPEPATLLLLGIGLLGFAGWQRYSTRA